MWAYEQVNGREIEGEAVAINMRHRILPLYIGPAPSNDDAKLDYMEAEGALH